MNKLSEPIFTTRKTVTLELPLNKHNLILHPEQVVLKIDGRYYDFGARCYSLRSTQHKKRGQSKEVVISSLVKQRTKQILQIIKALARLVLDGGKSIATTSNYANCFLTFLDWAENNNIHDCIAGGEATRNAFRAWAAHTSECYRQQKFGGSNHNRRLTIVCELLEAATGVDNLMQNIRKVAQKCNAAAGTDPLAVSDFAHAVALNQSLFDGLCDLVLENRAFPYRLDLPASLGWNANLLWLFPTNVWRRPPHRMGDTIRAATGARGAWPYDYENGRLATIDEIENRYKGTRWERYKSARSSMRRARIQLDEANANPHHPWRLTLGRVAQRAFLTLFFCNTGGNLQVVRDLETDGTINTAVHNQKFRALKWRASGKEVSLIAPATFMPRLRRYMELRRYLLQGRNTPYLFFSCGNRNNHPPTKISRSESELHYRRILTVIDPRLPRMAPRTLRASVDDYYLRLTDSAVAAAVMGHTVETEEKKYARGSSNDHHEEMSLFMESVSESARRQRVTSMNEMTNVSVPLEQGGRCDSFGHPTRLADNPPVEPNCKTSEGCLFCKHRVLIAGAEDARKIASAAYVMEQLILGPKHEEALRPSIDKCDKDIEKIAAFQNCRAMVDEVRKDVYDNENLTPFWADKYHLFLELGIIS